MGYIDYRFYRHTLPDGSAPYVLSTYDYAADFSGKCATGYTVMQWDMPEGSGQLYNVCVPGSTDPTNPGSYKPDSTKAGPMAKADQDAMDRAKANIAEEAAKKAMEMVKFLEESKVSDAQTSVSDAAKKAAEENGGNEDDYIIDGANDDIVVEGNPEDKEDEHEPAGPPGDDPSEDENDDGDPEAPPETTYIEGPPAPEEEFYEELAHMGDWCPGCRFDWENYLIVGIPNDEWDPSPSGEPFTHHAKGWSEWVLGGLDQRYFLRKGEYGIWLEAGQWHWSATGRWSGGGALAEKQSTFMDWDYSVIYHGIANDEATDVAWGKKTELGLWGDPLSNIDSYSESYMKMVPNYGEDVWAPFEEVTTDTLGDWYYPEWFATYDIDISGTAEARGLLWRFGYYCDRGEDTGSKVRWEGDGCTYTYTGDVTNRHGWADGVLTNLDDDSDCSAWEFGVVHCWYNTEMSIIMEIVSALTPLDSSRYYKRIPTKKITKSDLTAIVGTAADDSDAVEDIYGTAATTTEEMVAEGTYETMPGSTPTTEEY